MPRKIRGPDIRTAPPDPPSQELLLRLLRYDQETGLLRWVAPQRRVRPGDIAGYLRPDGRRRVRIEGRLYYSYTLIWRMVTGVWAEWPGVYVDHKDTYGEKADWGDRWDNLRLATPSDNRCNGKIQAVNTSGYPGVSQTDDGKYVVRIGRHNKTFHIGTFYSFDRAVTARKAAEVRHFGEYQADHPSPQS